MVDVHHLGQEHLHAGSADYQRQYEPILYGWPEGAQRHWCGDRDQGDVWNIKKPQKNDLHPTMKPVELVERAIRNSSRPGNVVLDPFGGSGTTLIAAEKSGRLARLIELDPKYADVIVRRWQEWTGKQATRESDGALFDDQAASDFWPAARSESRNPSGTRGQAARDAVLLAGLAANRPAHPLLGGGVDRVRQGLVPEQPCFAHRPQSGVRGGCRGKVRTAGRGLAGGVRDGGHRQGPWRRWRVRSSCPKAPGFVLGGGDRGWCSSGGSSGLIVATPVTRCSIEKPAVVGFLDLFRSPRTGHVRA